MKKTLTALAATAALFAVAPTAIAGPPGPAFNGTVSDIFVNDTQVLLVVSGQVRGNCRGRFGPYNLTFNMADRGARMKFDMIMSAMEKGYRISGYVNGCGSSNINRLSQVSITR